MGLFEDAVIEWASGVALSPKLKQKNKEVVREGRKGEIIKGKDRK